MPGSWLTRSTIPLLAAFLLLAAPRAPAAERSESAALQSYDRARSILDAGVEAMGGRAALDAAQAVRRDYFDTWLDPNQGQHPWPQTPGAQPAPNSGFDRSPSWSYTDYAGRRFIEWQRFADSAAEYAVVVTAVSADRGFTTIRYVEEQPFLDEMAAEDLEAQRGRQFRRHPEGILRLALARPATLEWVGNYGQGDASVDVISFANSQGDRYCLWFDARTHLLSKIEWVRDHPTAGDTTAESTFTDYRRVGTLRLPFRYVDRAAGVVTRRLDITKVELNPRAPEDTFRPPRVSVAVEHDPLMPRAERISDSLYLIRGPYNVMFSVFPDHVVVFEAPVSSAYARQCLQLIHAAAPGKPIRYIVASHFHPDHVGGIRAYVSEGVTVLTTPDAKGVIEEALRARRTLNPDPFMLTPTSAFIETVTGEKSLDAGKVRARVYDFGPTPHVAQMLVAYFPDEKLLYVPDLMDVLTDQLVIAGVDSAAMMARVRALGLPVERFVPVHGVPIDGAHFRHAFEIRAKYVH